LDAERSVEGDEDLDAGRSVEGDEDLDAGRSMEGEEDVSSFLPFYPTSFIHTHLNYHYNSDCNFNLQGYEEGARGEEGEEGQDVPGNALWTRGSATLPDLPKTEEGKWVVYLEKHE
jgi:hypothetical protein